MLRNYYYLNRTVVELNNILSGAEVVEIFSQEKNSLLLSVPSDENIYRHLQISTNPLLPFLLVKNDHRKAKKNVIIYNVLNKPQLIEKIEISKSDRLIRIKLANLEIFFSITLDSANTLFFTLTVVPSGLSKVWYSSLSSSASGDGFPNPKSGRINPAPSIGKKLLLLTLYFLFFSNSSISFFL